MGLIQGRTQASLIILVAVTPAHRGLRSSPQQDFLAVELWHIPGEMSLFSHTGLCSLDLLLEHTHSVPCVYDDPLEKCLSGLA